MKVTEMLTHSRVLILSTIAYNDYKMILGSLHAFKAMRFYKVCRIVDFTKDHGDDVKNANIMYNHIGQEVRSAKFADVMNHSGYILTFDRPMNKDEIVHEILTQKASAIIF